MGSHALATSGFGRVCLLLAALAGAVALSARREPNQVPARSVIPADTQPFTETVDQLLIDETGILTPQDLARTAPYLGLIRDESGIDVRVMCVPSVGNSSIEQVGLATARRIRLGARTGRRGVLFLYVADAQRLRIEVTPGLEGILPDAFVGYLMRENTEVFFAAGNAGLGLRQTLRILQFRLRRAALGAKYDPRPFLVDGDPSRLAFGGGVTHRIRRPGGLITAAATAEDSVRFAPGPSVQATFASYSSWLENDRFVAQLPFFTEASQAHLSRLPATKPYMDFWRMLELGRRYRIEERGNLAMVYFIDDPLPNPHFFRRDSLWRFDMMVELAQTTEYSGGRWSWSYLRGNDEFSTTFADMFIDVEGVVRVRGGDNRPLPTSRGRH